MSHSPSACVGQSGQQLLLWLLGLSISANFIPKFTNMRPTGTSEYTSLRHARRERQPPLKVKEELKNTALDALSLQSIWNHSWINESGVTSHPSKERGVRVKLFELQHYIHLYHREVVPATLRHIVVAQTLLHRPGPWQNKSEARLSSSDSRGLVVHCQVIGLNGVCGDVSPRVDVHETQFAEFCIHCVPCKPKKYLLSSVPR